MLFRSRIAALEARYHAHAPAFRAHPRVHDLRILGSILAFDLHASARGYLDPAGARLQRAAFARGLYLRPLGDVVYLMPPAATPPEVLDDALTALLAALDDA